MKSREYVLDVFPPFQKDLRFHVDNHHVRQERRSEVLRPAYAILELVYPKTAPSRSRPRGRPIFFPLPLAFTPPKGVHL